MLFGTVQVPVEFVFGFFAERIGDNSTLNQNSVNGHLVCRIVIYMALITQNLL